MRPLRNGKVKVRPDCGKKMAMTIDETSRDAEIRKLEERAFAYVARYACSEQRLRRYLERAIRRGGFVPPEQAAPYIGPIVDKLRQLGALDDSAFAHARAQSLARRGQGKPSIAARLAADGIDRTRVAASLDDIDAIEAAVRFMQRRRFGPYRLKAADDSTARRELAAMARAGHPPDLARRLLGCADDAALTALVEELSA